MNTLCPSRWAVLCISTAQISRPRRRWPSSASANGNVGSRGRGGAVESGMLRVGRNTFETKRRRKKCFRTFVPPVFLYSKHVHLTPPPNSFCPLPSPPSPSRRHWRSMFKGRHSVRWRYRGPPIAMGMHVFSRAFRLHHHHHGGITLSW